MTKTYENREVVESWKKNFEDFPIWDINNLIGKFSVSFFFKEIPLNF